MEILSWIVSFDVSGSRCCWVIIPDWSRLCFLPSISIWNCCRIYLIFCEFPLLKLKIGWIRSDCLIFWKSFLLLVKVPVREITCLNIFLLEIIMKKIWKLNINIGFDVELLIKNMCYFLEMFMKMFLNLLFKIDFG